MKMRNISIAVGLLVMGCSSAPAGAPSDAAPKRYAEMTFEERALFMNDVIVPRMRETFVAFDAKFATLSCANCHGEGVTNGSYAMPSASVPKLPGSEEAFFEYIKDPEHARWSQFMMDKVWPQMAALLDVPMFDPSTHAEGFSCSNCHTLAAVER